MPASWVYSNVNVSIMESCLAQSKAAANHPAMVVIQEIRGVNSRIQSEVDRLLSQGYVGLAPPMFRHKGPMTTDLPEEMDTTIARFGRCTDIDILSYIRAAVDYIEA